MKKAIELIEKLIREHEDADYCTDYDRATEHMEIDLEQSTDMFYDAGRYETLVNLLNDLKKLEDN